jgi:hypothetical protein
VTKPDKLIYSFCEVQKKVKHTKRLFGIDLLTMLREI